MVQVDLRTWQGRTYDLLALQAEPDRPGAQQARMVLVEPGQHTGRVATGLQKLAQRVLLELLTDRGSLAYLPEAGTDLLREVRSGRVRFLSDAIALASRALAQVLARLQGEQLAEDPQEEQLQDLELLSVQIQRDSLTLRVQLTTAAGSARELIVPIPLLPGGTLQLLQEGNSSSA